EFKNILEVKIVSICLDEVNVMDTLSRLSHDADSEVAMRNGQVKLLNYGFRSVWFVNLYNSICQFKIRRAAIISLGSIGAGTNNARIAGMLQNLSSYYYKMPAFYTVRIAQGLVHLGKGLLTLSSYHSERKSLVGLVIMLHACDEKWAIRVKPHSGTGCHAVKAVAPRAPHFVMPHHLLTPRRPATPRLAIISARCRV
ncbi:26S proteasome non-ATPase regulatory subunit, partial [Striga asiatica]